MNRLTFFLALPAVLFSTGLSVQAARAQTAPADVPVSLNVTHGTIPDALRILFQQAGIHNYVLDVHADGRVNASLHEVPFALALRQVLAAANPPLTAQIESGVYHVVMRLTDPSNSVGPTRFFKIGIRHYDAGMLAHLANRGEGLIDVPPNFVVTANSSAMPSAMVLKRPAVPGESPGIVPPGEDSRNSGSSPAIPSSEPVLPDGVKRIFALQSDNSLVIEATPKGFHDLTDLQLAAEGYDLVL